jgi:hypothetical protein
VTRFFRDDANRARYFPQYEGYDSKQLARACRMEKFSRNVAEWDGTGEIERGEEHFVLFTYLGGVKTCVIKNQGRGL